MEVSFRLLAPAAFLRGKSPQYQLKKGACWASVSDWRRRQRGKLYYCTCRSLHPGRPACSLISILQIGIEYGTFTRMGCNSNLPFVVLRRYYIMHSNISVTILCSLVAIDISDNDLNAERKCHEMSYRIASSSITFVPEFRHANI